MSTLFRLVSRVLSDPPARHPEDIASRVLSDPPAPPSSDQPPPIDLTETRNLKSLFSELTYVPSNSASSTVVLEVLLKAGRPSADGRDNSLLTEIKVYTQIINTMYRGRISPHLIPSLGAFRCSDFLRSIGEVSHDLQAVRDRWEEIIDEAVTDDTWVGPFRAERC